jgi:predicted GTPase
VTPICFSDDTKFRFVNCTNPVIIIIEGKTGSGKSTRLNQLTNADMTSEMPFRRGADGKGVTTEFVAWGPVTLTKFCGMWDIPVDGHREINLFFVDSEGTGNANGVDDNLGKALAIV